MIINIDIDKVNDLLNNIDAQINEYNQNIDSFFKDLMSNSSLFTENTKEYNEYIAREMIIYKNYSESLKKFINTTRYTISDLNTLIINNEVE